MDKKFLIYLSKDEYDLVLRSLVYTITMLTYLPPVEKNNKVSVGHFKLRCVKLVEKLKERGKKYGM